MSTAQANYDGNYPQKGCPKGKYRKTTTMVGSFRGNAWGLKDMAGNVWEWTYDRYQSSYRGLPSLDPVGPIPGSSRVCRGGGWYDDGWRMRAASRGSVLLGIRSLYVGFRLLRVD